MAKCFESFFVSSPAIRLNVHDEDKSGNFVLHCVQMVPKKTFKTHEFHKMALVKPDFDSTHVFKVKVGTIGPRLRREFRLILAGM